MVREIRHYCEKVVAFRSLDVKVLVCNQQFKPAMVHPLFSSM